MVGALADVFGPAAGPSGYCGPSVDELFADASGDFKKYQLQDIMDPNDLIKVDYQALKIR